MGIGKQNGFVANFMLKLHKFPLRFFLPSRILFILYKNLNSFTAFTQELIYDKEETCRSVHVYVISFGYFLREKIIHCVKYNVFNNGIIKRSYLFHDSNFKCLAIKFVCRYHKEGMLLKL